MPSELIEQQQPANPLAILAAAVERGCDPDSLGKLLALQERYEANQARQAYAVAMHACQAEMPRVVRDKKNTQTGSRYGSLEQVQRQAQPIYSKHGFSLSYGEADCPREGAKRTICDLRHTGGHCERYHLDLSTDGIGPKGNPIGGMNKIQGEISTTSYGQRRLLCMIFNITICDEDDDGQAGSYVTEEQSITLQQWLEQTGTNLEAFLKWGSAESLAKFPASKYDDAIRFFQKKAKQ
jgi:hypothetical protein